MPRKRVQKPEKAGEERIRGTFQMNADDERKIAELAKQLSEETGLRATASDVIRVAVRHFYEVKKKK